MDEPAWKTCKIGRKESLAGIRMNACAGCGKPDRAEASRAGAVEHRRPGGHQRRWQDPLPVLQ